MKQTLLIICIFFLFFSGTFSTMQNGKYRIEGTIDKSFNGQKAKLSLMNDDQLPSRSFFSVIDQGRFSFEGDEYLNNLSSITIIEDNSGEEVTTHYGLELLLESGTIKVSLSKDRAFLGGTHLNEIFSVFQDSMKYLLSEINKGAIIKDAFISYPIESASLFTATGDYYIDFTKHNFQNSLGKALLMKFLNNRYVFQVMYVVININRLDEILAFVDDETRTNPNFVSFMNKQKEKIASEEFKSYIIGTKIQNFTLNTQNDETKQLYDFFEKKDFVFLEFWASWCGPCIASIPTLKEIHEKFSDKIDIVSISLDTDQKSWTNAMDKQKMPWSQFVDLKGYDSDIAKSFELKGKGIPFGLLLDKKGAIVKFCHPDELLLSLSKE